MVSLRHSCIFFPTHDEDGGGGDDDDDDDDVDDDDALLRFSITCKLQVQN